MSRLNRSNDVTIARRGSEDEDKEEAGSSVERRRRGDSDKVMMTEASVGGGRPLCRLPVHCDWRHSVNDQMKGIGGGALVKLWMRCQQTRLAGNVVTVRVLFALLLIAS
jgi:hypothetical protein